MGTAFVMDNEEAIHIQGSNANFLFNDTDSNINEILEFYHSSDDLEVKNNCSCYEEVLLYFDLTAHFNELSELRQLAVTDYLLDCLERSDDLSRLTALRALLFIIQGCPSSAYTLEEQLTFISANVHFLYKRNVFSTCATIFVSETGKIISIANFSDNYNALNIVLNIMYIFVETLRTERPEDVDKAQLREELLVPIGEDGILANTLFNLVHFSLSRLNNSFSIKKVCLLLWKVLLLSLGDYDTYNSRKALMRKRLGLLPYTYCSSCKYGKRLKLNVETNDISDSNFCCSGMFAENDTTCYDIRTETLPDCLSCRTKISRLDILKFIDSCRMKFIGYTFDDDTETTSGLPHSINESLSVMKSYMFVSIAEYQIEQEKLHESYPLTHKPFPISHTSAEILFSFFFENISKYMISLLKVLLSSTSSSAHKYEDTNVRSNLEKSEKSDSFQQYVEVNREKEIVVKSVLSTILLLMKHLKFNHVYQFEFVAQNLVFANCIPLMIKLLEQDIFTFMKTHNNVSFPNLFPGLVKCEDLKADSEKYSWRNVFSVINLLRVLKKLCKGKRSRILMLVMFKSSQILKSMTDIKEPTLNLYVLKLIKMQSRYLGRQWRRFNMSIISDIYRKIRHSINDDWAYGNLTDARPWDFRGDERDLRVQIDKFLERRYAKREKREEWKIQDAVENEAVELGTAFIHHYHSWAEREVYGCSTAWEVVLYE